MDINEIKIRKMVEADIDFIIRANKEVREASNQTNAIFELRRRLMDDILSDEPKAYIIVTEYNNQLIGMALYSTVYFADNGETMWLSNIFVEADYQNKGIAKEMIKHLKQICKNENYCAIWAAVEDENEKSKTFFDSINGKWLNGFKMVGVEENK